MLGVCARLVPQNNMGGLLRRHRLDAFVPQSPQVHSFEQPFSPTDEHRRDGNVQLIDEALTKILLQLELVSSSFLAWVDGQLPANPTIRVVHNHHVVPV